jgi:hypothetical protein
MPNDDRESVAGAAMLGQALPQAEDVAEESPKLSAGLGSSRKPAIIGGVIIVVILAVFVGLGVLLFNNPDATSRLRDIFIILLGIETMLICVLILLLLIALVYVALKLYDLTQFVEDEVRPMLNRADDAIRTVHSRTVFIADTAVKPVVDVMSYIAAVKSIIRTFTRPRK